MEIQRKMVLNTYNIRDLISGAERLVTYPKLNGAFRSRDTDFSRAYLNEYIKLGLIKVVAQETESREIPLGYREYGNIVELETSREVEKHEMRVGYTYKCKETKTIKGCYFNIYKLTFGSVREVKEAIKKVLSDQYGEIKVNY